MLWKDLLTAVSVSCSWFLSSSRELPGTAEVAGTEESGNANTSGRPVESTEFECVEIVAFTRNISLAAEEIRQAVSLGEAEASGK